MSRPAARLICCLCEMHQARHDAGILSSGRIQKESIVRERLNRSHGPTIERRSWPDDGHWTEILIKKMSRFRHDQIGLQRVSVGRFGVCFSLCDVKIKKGHRGFVHGIGHCQRRVTLIGVPGFVLPGLKVHRLTRADAEQNSQYLQVGHLLSQRRVQAGAPLLDESKVESSGECNGLKTRGYACRWIARIASRRVVVAPGNRRKPPTVQTVCSVRISGGLNKFGGGIEVRVRYAAVPRPKTRIDG